VESGSPPKAIASARRETIPEIARSVVVFPAPLRPTSPTTSPGRISRSTPVSTTARP
jgi:hypothetical protein